MLIKRGFFGSRFLFVLTVRCWSFIRGRDSELTGCCRPITVSGEIVCGWRLTPDSGRLRNFLLIKAQVCSRLFVITIACSNHQDSVSIFLFDNETITYEKILEVANLHYTDKRVCIV